MANIVQKMSLYLLIIYFKHVFNVYRLPIMRLKFYQNEEKLQREEQKQNIQYTNIGFMYIKDKVDCFSKWKYPNNSTSKQ